MSKVCALRRGICHSNSDEKQTIPCIVLRIIAIVLGALAVAVGIASLFGVQMPSIGPLNDMIAGATIAGGCVLLLGATFIKCVKESSKRQDTNPIPTIKIENQTTKNEEVLLHESIATLNAQLNDEADITKKVDILLDHFKKFSNIQQIIEAKKLIADQENKYDLNNKIQSVLKARFDELMQKFISNPNTENLKKVAVVATEMDCGNEKKIKMTEVCIKGLRFKEAKELLVDLNILNTDEIQELWLQLCDSQSTTDDKLDILNEARKANQKNEYKQYTFGWKLIEKEASISLERAKTNIEGNLDPYWRVNAWLWIAENYRESLAEGIKNAKIQAAKVPCTIVSFLHDSCWVKIVAFEKKHDLPEAERNIDQLKDGKLKEKLRGAFNDNKIEDFIKLEKIE